MKRTKFYIGIDCGTKTGFAIWDSTRKCFIEIETLKIHDAMMRIKQLSLDGVVMELRIEDARQVRFKVDAAKAQGAGSVKRDAAIWEDMCKDWKIPFKMVRPNKALTKWDDKKFATQTKWEKRTSSHGRDAALLVYGI